ncbi:MAG: RluA family pseudouridine synthase [Blautia sp.]|nr:RluA family pseudouridine synthase [Blautia sp.]
MERRIEYRLQPEDAGTYRTALDVLKKELRLTVRQIRTSKYLPGGILLNGERITVRHPVVPGDALSVLLEEKEPPSALQVWHDESIVVPIDILWEDEDVVILNKPAGIPVHPSHGHYADTMANALCGFYQKQGLTLVPRSVGRLDKDTSGAILFAKNRTAASRLSGQGTMHKTYLALVSGLVGRDTFTIDLPLKKETDVLNRMIVSPDGKTAVTHGRVLERFTGRDSTLLRLTLETGRTHQIRVHMAAAGHPLLGDPIYNPRSQKENPDDPKGTTRALLHCESIQFMHPFTNTSVTVTAPVPEDFRP